jgi:hypothetical protein
MSTKEDKESKKPDYDEDENQLEEKQEKETREQETTITFSDFLIDSQ